MPLPDSLNRKPRDPLGTCGRPVAASTRRNSFCFVRKNPGAIAFTRMFAGARWTASHSVRLFTDDFAAEYNVPAVDFVKLDVEGAEDLILEPFLMTAPRTLWPKALLMEFSHGKWATDLPRLLSACGYREALRTRQNVGYVLEGE